MGIEKLTKFQLNKYGFFRRDDQPRDEIPFYLRSYIYYDPRETNPKIARTQRYVAVAFSGNGDGGCIVSVGTLNRVRLGGDYIFEGMEMALIHSVNDLKRFWYGITGVKLTEIKTK